MVIMIFAVVKPYIQTPKCEVLISCCLYQEVSRPKGGLSAELCLSVSQKPNWKTHTLNNFLSFFSFLGAAIAGVYKAAGKTMISLEALVFGVGQSFCVLLISFLRILATL